MLYPVAWEHADLYLKVLEGQVIDYNKAYANVIVHEVFYHGVAQGNRIFSSDEHC
jgi:hypothetical protein